jgi:hypothetical protein
MGEGGHQSPRGLRRFERWVLAVPIVMLVSTHCLALQNPVSILIDMQWRDSSGNHGSEPFAASCYDVGLEPWDGHCTINSTERFAHSHVNDQWPKGTPSHSAADAKRYFDYKWSGYKSEQSQGTADPAHNCASYAFEKMFCWVDSDTEILSDEYTGAGADTATIAVWQGYHVVKVSQSSYQTSYTDCNGTHYSPPIWYISQVVQKDRGSAIFTYNYGQQHPWGGTLSPVRDQDTGTLVANVPLDTPAALGKRK